ncbi:MAG: type II secretion system F family protein [bacterium]|nr:type II secretion system F family protein [bacterium]
MIFKFKAQKPDGSVYEERRESPDKFALYRELKKEGDIVISAVEEGKKSKFNLGFILGFFGNIALREKILFAKNLGSMLKAGLSLSRALDVIIRDSRNKKLKAVVGRLSDDVRRGETLHEALAKHQTVFPALFVSMVKAGEESGSLAESLAIVADQMDKIYSLQRKVRGALIYPVIIICLMIVITVVMLIYVVPNLTETFADLEVDLPLSTRFIISLSDLVQNQGIMVLGAILLFLTSVVYLARTKKGKFFLHLFYVKVPLIGELVKEVNSARTARTLSSLLYSGVDVMSAISIAGEVVQNVHYKAVLEEASQEIKKGSPLSTAFAAHEDLYPPFVGEMASVGEETGKLSEMFSEVAIFYENNVDQKTKNFSALIEPFLMIAIGVGVGFFAISMLSPTLSLVNAL